MRHAKQFLYGVFYLMLWAAIASGIYYFFLKPAPTCFDNIRNQNEEGVDCGGVCSKQCLPDLKPLSGGQIYTMLLPSASTTGRASIVAEVRNPNPDWAAKNFNYVIHVYDISGAEIGSVPGSDYIYAGELKYISATNRSFAGTPASASVTLADPLWKKDAEFPKPDLTVNLTRTDAGQVYAARGTITNNGALPVNVDILAIFYDSNGVPQGASTGLLERVTAGDTRDFAVFHPLLNTIAPDRTKIFASAYTVQ